ncbi:MAG: thioredoxin-disulfide reductase [Anaerolineaceae bacterium]|nr:thioredoxin-disulfide reductase [Anaerolineaceae bacterium]
MNEGKKRVVVIGSGPAGLTAALYTARAQLPTTVITGPLLGGQIATTHEVENYPGFPDGTTGPELVEAMRAQAGRFGTEYVYDSVARAQLAEGPPFRIETQGGETHEADAVIVTIGANPRALGIPGEAEYVGHGVSYCATCDGFFFRGKDVVVVGGDDSALQEALFLTRFATRVDIIHRRDALRASVALQSRAFAHEKIHFTWDSVVDEIRANGSGSVNEIVTRNVKSGEQQERPVDGVFIFIGYDPNSDVFEGQLATDDAGYVLIDQRYRSNIEGVFAAGEIHDQIFRQAITAAGDGCAAALTAIDWLDSE